MDQEFELVPLTKAQKITRPRPSIVRCQLCSAAAVVKLIETLYCQKCGDAAKAQNDLDKLKEKKLADSPLITLDEPKKFSQYPWGDRNPTAKTPWTNRCRVGMSSPHYKGKAFTHCGVYIPDHWEMCQGHLLKKYSLDTVYTAEYESKDALDEEEVVQVILRLEGIQ